MRTKSKNNQSITSQDIWLDVKSILNNLIYPALNSQIKHLHNYCIKHHLDEAELLIKNIKNDFDLLIKIEKSELFPAIDELVQIDKTPSNFQPFKEVKKYITTMQQNIARLLITAADNSHQALINDIKVFEKQLNEVQELKDKYFFVHFKNCSACKS